MNTRLALALAPLALRLAAAADSPSLGYRGVLQPASLQSADSSSGADIWRLSAAQGLPPPERTAASTTGYGWLTEGSESWNMVNTFTALEAPVQAGRPRQARPGDFYYIFPLHDRVPNSPPPLLAAPRRPEDLYRDASTGNVVPVTPNPALPADEKVFVRYTLDTWSQRVEPTAKSTAPQPAAPPSPVSKPAAP